MKKHLLFIATICIMIFIFTGCFIGCKDEGDGEIEINTSKKVPIYTGMTVSNKNNNAVEKVSFKFDDIKDLIDGDYEGRDDVFDDDNPFDKDEDEDDIEDEINKSFKVEGAAKSTYYTKSNQDFYVTIHINNPDKFEIVSFVFNGEKYTSYMFEKGSDLENIILKCNEKEAKGFIDYTIDQIKYIDGTSIKDVKIEGDKTVKIGVFESLNISAIVTNQKVDFDKFSCDVKTTDINEILKNNDSKFKAVLYDGTKIVETKDLIVGDNKIAFEGLKLNSIYQFAVIGLYDNYDEQGNKYNVIYQTTIKTKSLLYITDIALDKNTISWNYIWDDNALNKEIKSIKFIDRDKEQSLDTSTKSLSNLSTNHSYRLEVYYLDNNNKEAQVVLDFKTLGMYKPQYSIENFEVKGLDIKFNVKETDLDNVGELYRIDIIDPANTVVKTINKFTSDMFEIKGLLPLTKYTLKVSYKYDLKQGAGIEYGSVIKEFESGEKEILVSDVLNLVNDTYKKNGYENIEIIGKVCEIDLDLENKKSNQENFENYHMNIKFKLDLLQSLNNGIGDNYLDLNITKDGENILRVYYDNMKQGYEDKVYIKNKNQENTYQFINFAQELKSYLKINNIGINPSQGEIEAGKYYEHISDKQINNQINEIKKNIATIFNEVGRNAKISKEAGTASFELPISAIGKAVETPEFVKILFAKLEPVLKALKFKSPVEDHMYLETYDLLKHVFKDVYLKVEFDNLNTLPTMRMRYNLGEDNFDFNINSMTPNKGLQVKSPAYKGKLEAQLKVGKDVSMRQEPSYIDDGKNKNILNFETTGFVHFKTDVRKDYPVFQLHLPAGEYKYTIKADLKLAGIIDILEDGFIDPINAMIECIDNVINYLEIDIHNKNNEYDKLFYVKINPNASVNQIEIEASKLMDISLRANTVQEFVQALDNMFTLHNFFTMPMIQKIKIGNKNYVKWTEATDIINHKEKPDYYEVSIGYYDFNKHDIVYDRSSVKRVEANNEGVYLCEIPDSGHYSVMVTTSSKQLANGRSIYPNSRVIDNLSREEYLDKKANINKYNEIKNQQRMKMIESIGKELNLVVDNTIKGQENITGQLGTVKVAEENMDNYLVTVTLSIKNFTIKNDMKIFEDVEIIQTEPNFQMNDGSKIITRALFSVQAGPIKFGTVIPQ